MANEQNAKDLMPPTIYADIPRHFWDRTSPIHEDVRLAYGALIGAAAKLGCQLSTAPYVAALNDGLSAGTKHGLHYAYHASRPGQNTWCFKPGPIYGRWYMDPCGYSGWSSIAADKTIQDAGLNFDLEQATNAIQSLRKTFLSDNLSRYAQRDLGVPDALRGRRYVFYPMQIGSDKVMEFARFSQSEVARHLAKYAEEHGCAVAVKRHPLCKADLVTETLRDLSGDNFIVTDASVHSLISESVGVVVCNSGVGLEALIHGKPVHSYGGSEYSHLTTEIKDLADLEAPFRDDPVVPSSDSIRSLGYLLETFFVPAHDVQALATRMAQHLEQASIATEEPGAKPFEPPAHLSPSASLLHALERRIDDSVDFLLAAYPNVTDGIKDRIAILLARATRFESRRERILRGADTRIFRRYVNVLIADGKLEDAGVLAQHLIDRTGSSEDILALAKLRYRQNRTAEGLMLARKAAAAPQPSAESLVFLGRKIFDMSPAALEEALLLASEALQIDPAYADGLWLRSRAAHFLGRQEQAEADILAALSLAPDDSRYARLKERILSSRAAAMAGA